MAKAKKDEAVDEMTPAPGLPPRFMFAVGERVSGHGIVGEVVTQDGPWTVTVQQDRGGKITAAVTLLSQA
ncbi:hypothetical protein [Methylobacterium radiodurans]|uniref:Uncharacterized protein n=1 Tax=Methylobacterium radiodurans TaxID=2202828 RepID=A0A2U8VPR4_9HYPH|nr:hypothetical protein [Methylobacterium radiodurans]AWN35689.1 hypothetical protein DK427_07985 [Methylobacterium radiodurans]